MSGQIINPFSSDFNPSSSISFSAEPMPILAYGLIGLTSLTLAYVTLIETTQGDMSAKQSSVSATSMLPSIGSSIGTSFGLSSKPESPSMQVSPFSSISTDATTSSNVSPIESSAEIVNRSPPLVQAVPITPDKPAIGGKTKRRKNKNKKTKRRRNVK
jgi:hypothetical protein